MASDNIVVGNLRTVLGLDATSFDAGAKKAATSAQALASKLTSSMKGVETQFKTSERAIANFEKSLRGDRLISTANNITKAVSNIGGATKLTDAEATRLNHTLDKAIQKYRALGVEAPAAMRKLHAETSKLDTATAKATGFQSFKTQFFGGGTATQLAAGFTLATMATGAARGLVNLTQEIIVNAGRLEDLSHKTGLSTRALQRMEFIAGQTGSTLEQLADASFRLSARIAAGGSDIDRAIDALKKYGLNAEALKRAKPQEQLEMVADALRKVEDVGERSSLGMAMMGRTYANVAASVSQDMKKLGDAAGAMSDEQVKALAEVGDALDALMLKSKQSAGAMMADLLLAAQGRKELSKQQLGGIAGIAPPITGPIAALLQLSGALGPIGGRGDVRLEREKLSGAKVVDPTFVQQLAEIDKAIASLTKTERAEIDAALELGVSVEELEKKYPALEGAISRYRSLQAEATKATRATTRAMKDQQQVAEAPGPLPSFLPPAIRDLMGLSAQDFAASPDAGIMRGGLGFAGIGVDADAMRDAVGHLKIWDDTNSSILATGEDIQALLEQHSDTLDELPEHLQDASEETRTWHDHMLTGLDAALQVAGAVQNMEAALDGMATSTSRTANVLNGALAGAQQFSFMGPYGAIFGAGLGAAAGAMQDPRSQVLMAMNAFRVGIIQQFQETSTLAQQAEAGNDRWRQMTILVRDAYEDLGMTAADAQRDVDRLFDSDDLLEYQRNLERINEALMRQNELTDARLQRQELLNEAVERWGLSFEEAGKGFQRGSLASQAELLIQDFQLLTESGADMTLVVERMSGAVNEFVAQAVEAGVEIPESMRPLLEAMVDAGLLTDKTGKVVENLSDAGIRFGAELESMFERVLEKLDILIQRLMAPFSDVPLGRFGPRTGSTAVQRTGETPERDFFRTPDPVEATVNPFWPFFRFHEGGIITAHGGKFLERDEVLVKALTGESVLSRFATQMIGGKRGVDALNMGVSPFAGMRSALASMAAPQSFSTSAAELLRGSLRDASGSAGLRIGDDGGPFHVTLGPGAIVVNGAGEKPERIAGIIVEELPRAIDHNRKGLRTKLRKQLQ